MEFTIKQNELDKGLSFVSSATDRKMEILTFIRIETLGENALRLTGTDLEITSRCDVVGDVESPGSVLIEAKRLAAIVNGLPDDELYFTVDDQHWVTLTSGKSKYRFAGLSADKYPQDIETVPPQATLATGDLKGLIKRTSFAIDAKSSKFQLNGVQCEIRENTLRLVAMDGYRLPIAEAPAKFNTGDTFLIPMRAVTELAKVDSSTLGIANTQNHLFFSWPDHLIVSRKPQGTFPAYEKVIPADCELEVTFNADAMRDAVKRASLMANDEMQALKFAFDGDEAVVSTISRSAGEGEERVAVEYAGEPITLGFRVGHVLQFLNLIADLGDAKIAFSENARGNTIWTAVSDSTYRYILNPLSVEIATANAERKAATV